MLWRGGQEPRFELVDSSTDEVATAISLEDKSSADIEAMLANYGYSPQKK